MQAAACFGYKRAYSMIIKHFSWKTYHEASNKWSNKFFIIAWLCLKVSLLNYIGYNKSYAVVASNQITTLSFVDTYKFIRYKYVDSRNLSFHGVDSSQWPCSNCATSLWSITNKNFFARVAYCGKYFILFFTYCHCSVWRCLGL